MRDARSDFPLDTRMRAKVTPGVPSNADAQGTI
jgi:hypothetical protein